MKFAVTFPYGPLGAVTAFGDHAVVGPEGAVRDTLPLGAVKPKSRRQSDRGADAGPDEGFGARRPRGTRPRSGANSRFRARAGGRLQLHLIPDEPSAKFFDGGVQVGVDRDACRNSTRPPSKSPMRPMTQMEMMARETSGSTRVSPASRDRI